ncbi:MAG: hypothetical protein J6S50_00420 [Oscillospiraceae bacterium]|nr:hypothetical protein [Kiritimatiellia bacterium]MBO7726893.1 hypothetical protein [Oscillospiraceae bacterium]MBO7726965.1 hypothetical protein [Oscillospiraceae bacterium]
MSKEDLIRKLTSRKFWAAVCAFVTLLLVALGSDESEAKQVAAIIMAGATVLSYILGEGMIDAAREGKREDTEEYTE